MATERHKRIARVIKTLTYEEMNFLASWFADQSHRDDDDAPDMGCHSDVANLFGSWATSVLEDEI